MSETKVICEVCKQWIGRLPNVIGNSLKSQETAIQSGWSGLWVTSIKDRRGRRIWYCPECAKKTTVKEMVDSV